MNTHPAAVRHHPARSSGASISTRNNPKPIEAMLFMLPGIDESEAQIRFEKMTATFKDSAALEGIVVTDDDVIIVGRSTRELVKSVMQMENRTVEFMKLIVPEAGTLDDITYQEIDEEFPFPVQLEMLNKISEAIQPGYKDSRKN